VSEYAEKAAAEMSGRSRELFESVMAELCSQEAGESTHVELEEMLMVRSRELMRSLLQDHLDLRAVREQRREQVTDAEGEP